MAERLKGEKNIQHLFREGSQVFVFPLKAVYFLQEADHESGASVQLGVSVSKRQLKRAVDRNKMKRRMREAIRKIEGKFDFGDKRVLRCMLIYVTGELLEVKLLEKSLDRILTKINKVRPSEKSFFEKNEK